MTAIEIRYLRVLCSMIRSHQSWPISPDRPDHFMSTGLALTDHRTRESGLRDSYRSRKGGLYYDMQPCSTVSAALSRAAGWTCRSPGSVSTSHMTATSERAAEHGKVTWILWRARLSFGHCALLTRPTPSTSCHPWGPGRPFSWQS